MANVQFNTYTPPERQNRDTTQYVYYTRNGEYLGGVLDSKKIYTTTRETYDAAVAARDYSSVNDSLFLIKYDGNPISHSDFRYIAYIVSHESGNEDIRELRCIAFTSYNRSESQKKTWRDLLASGYSSVPDKIEMPTSNGNKNKLARQAVLDVLVGLEDITNGAEFWDGTDFLAWGNSEQNPYNKLGQNKFDEYKFIEIPRDIYDDFLAAQGSTTVNYPDRENHKSDNEHGDHTHIEVKNKQGVVKKKIKYDLPANDFENEDYWASGNFYYDTGVNKTNGISATITAGKSIFWKLTSERLTPATPAVQTTP